MAERISPELRRLVAARADYLCEYCLIAEDDTFYGCEVDHVIAVKHGGLTEADNLAYACVFCNRHKGSDIASISLRSGLYIRFFNPRKDRWSEHFQLQGLHIDSVSEIGEVTVRIFRFNDDERMLERQELKAAGRYPNPFAKARMKV
jgi:hypothetical protein